MLDTRFPRPVGDLGNLATWPVQVNIRVVRGIWPGTSGWGGGPAEVVTPADLRRFHDVVRAMAAVA